MSQPGAKETPCPDCGEMVRVNSLRCWNCGGFMNPEVEQRFMAMQANPAPTIFSEVPASEMHSFEEEADDDFELAVPSPKKPAAQAAPVSAPEKSADEVKKDDSSETSSKSSDEGPQVPHSVATGGDALLDIAIQEERELRKRSKGRKQLGGMRTPGGGLIIFCPYGCRVEVKEQHRGMTGKCPRCAAPFIVPVEGPQFKKEKKEAASGDAAVSEKAFRNWLFDLHLHVVSPEKFKLKADSLLKEFVEADVGFSNEVLLAIVLGKKPAAGMFAKAGDKKGNEQRDAAIEHLNEGKPIADLPASKKYAFPRDLLSQLKVVQPAASRGDSIFHGIAVFGEGRIALQLPHIEETKDPTYLSLGLTQFWDFRKALEEIYDIVGFGDDAGIPKKITNSIYKCHYTDALIKAVNEVEYLKADPTVELEVAGYQCGSCKLTVSEAGRKKENLGGKSPKGIAKAKCPKCSNKMGEHLLYSLKTEVSEPSMSGETEA